MLDVLKQIMMQLRENKKYWLMPIVLILVLLGAVIVFSSGSVFAPFIYTLF